MDSAAPASRRGERRPISPTATRWIRVACVLVALALVGTTVWVAVAPWRAETGVRSRAAVETRSLVADRPEVQAASLLDAWDRSRAAAWAGGDVAGLEALYVDGSAAGRVDVAMLDRWVGRGLRVEGLRTQVLGVRVVEHRRGRWVLEVEDRVAAGTVRTTDRAGEGAAGEWAGAEVARLPGDSARSSRVVLTRPPGTAGWLVAEVTRLSAERSSAPR